MLQPVNKPWSKNKAFRAKMEKQKIKRKTRSKQKREKLIIQEKNHFSQEDIDNLLEDDKVLRQFKRRKV